ncbi:acetyl-CoA C-acetyltransferase [Helcobacillus sp. ACRRO]|uniref:acetyl-CoA C-acetyltransferase n=1 Tax=Helcobacillus sp. ACRRO TaxID=2918202 RepID=UPI001EF3F434|nr:acetyl-CoA C-acetyltransferase [Helcobacillus sp. ACRRO]
MPTPVIVAATRTPIGRARKGSLKDLRPDDLAAHIITAALEKVPALDVADIEDLQLGCAIPEGHQGGNLARTVAILAGLDHVPGATVTRFCASSLEATRNAANAITAGQAEVVIAAGVESLSIGAGARIIDEDVRNPIFRDAWERTEKRAQSAPGEIPWRDPRESGELPDPYIAMGLTAENVAEHCGISRADQDAWAVMSQNRAEQAQKSGFFAREITPVTLSDGTVIDTDDSPRHGATLEATGALEPVFRPGGTVTAGNACPINDGAAALILMSEEKARELGLRPLARVVTSAVTGLSPEIMGLGPIDSTRRALDQAGLTMEDIDLVELNEAFAAQVLASQRELGIPDDKLNVHGGAIALGHPWGMTGARLITTLINGLEERDGRYGLATLCVGGGQGMAVIIERIR